MTFIEVRVTLKKLPHPWPTGLKVREIRGFQMKIHCKCLHPRYDFTMTKMTLSWFFYDNFSDSVKISYWWVPQCWFKVPNSQPYFLLVLNWKEGKFLSKIDGFRNPLFNNWWVPRNPLNPCQRSHWICSILPFSLLL